MEKLPLPRGRVLALEPFAVMGVLNTTPDSFHAASRRTTLAAAREAALAMLASGAAIIDIGGESTRPGSAPVDEAEELERVIPAIEALRRESDAAISVDTRKAAVWKAALDAGADILNDVSALRDSPEAGALAAKAGAPVVLMHMKGEPATMQEAPYYDDCPSEVRSFLLDAAARALAAGVPAERIVLDPGIGFGKRLEDNLALLSALDSLRDLGYPLLVGLSRKGFVGSLTGKPVEGRLAGSLGAAAAAWTLGARIFRVHDVAETRDLLLVLSSILGMKTRSPRAGASGAGRGG
ncbi:MAG TPA: dihydropteroate synthase [Rectinemataceae bacterium]|nr:dihydropteroate synthase [Rectinemataceae bacterium]